MSHTESEEQDLPTFLQSHSGDQWQPDPSRAVSSFPSPGKDPPLASLLWDGHLQLWLGECVSPMRKAWVSLAAQWSGKNIGFGVRGVWFWLSQEGDEMYPGTEHFPGRQVATVSGHLWGRDDFASAFLLRIPFLPEHSITSPFLAPNAFFSSLQGGAWPFLPSDS